MIQGYKTYLIAAAIGLVAALHALGYIDDATQQTLLTLLGAGGAASLAAKINRTASRR